MGEKILNGHYHLNNKLKSYLLEVVHIQLRVYQLSLYLILEKKLFNKHTSTKEGASGRVLHVRNASLKRAIHHSLQEARKSSSQVSESKG